MIINLFKLLRQAFFKSLDKNFFSQFGEDRIINEIFNSNIKNGFYVDVGCYHPIKHSNTFRLKKKGWSGINIDVEIDKIKVFNLTRRNDHNVFAPVSNKNEITRIYKTQNYGVGTTTKKDFIKNENKIIDSNLLQTQTLNHIIEQSPFNNREIDLLSIDTEGSDFDVLKSLNIEKYNPKIIIIESHLNKIEGVFESEIYKYLINKKYRLRSWAFYSLIFILPNSKELRDR